MTTSTKIRYIKDPSNPKRVFALRIDLQLNEDFELSDIQYSWAVNSPVDQFSRKSARAILDARIKSLDKSYPGRALIILGGTKAAAFYMKTGDVHPYVAVLLHLRQRLGRGSIYNLIQAEILNLRSSRDPRMAIPDRFDKFLHYHNRLLDRDDEVLNG